MWFNTDAFAEPDIPLGIAGRNTVYGRRRASAPPEKGNSEPQKPSRSVVAINSPVRAFCHDRYAFFPLSL